MPPFPRPSSKNIPAAFRTNVINSKSLDSASTAPVRHFIGSSFIHLRAGSVYLLAITRTNSNAMMILQFLSKVVDLIKSYCHGDFNEEVIKANFVLIYELLDEILDFGYPQISEPAVLKSLIFQKVLCRTAVAGVPRQGNGMPRAIGVAGAAQVVRSLGRLPVTIV